MKLLNEHTAVRATSYIMNSVSSGDVTKQSLTDFSEEAAAAFSVRSLEVGGIFFLLNSEKFATSLTTDPK